MRNEKLTVLIVYKAKARKKKNSRSSHSHLRWQAGAATLPNATPSFNPPVPCKKIRSP